MISRSVIVSMAKSRRRTRRRGGSSDSLDLLSFGNSLKQNGTLKLATKKDVEADFSGRIALIEISESETFQVATHKVGQVSKSNKKNKTIEVQAYNKSGDKSGKPDEEDPGDLWVLPAVGTVVKVGTDGKEMQIKSYDVRTREVFLRPPPSAEVVDAGDADDADDAETGKPPKKKSKKKKKQAKKQNLSTPVKLPDTPKKALDKVTTSTTEEIPESEVKYTLESVLRSFENPRCILFMESLKAEMKKNPELPTLTSAIYEAPNPESPPEILFGARRKGYFKARHLCRVWVLDTLRWLRTRGEFFVRWEDDENEYDGRFTLAHAFTIKYVSMHEPGLSIIFDRNGALKSTSNVFVRIRRYVIADTYVVYSVSHEPHAYVTYDTHASTSSKTTPFGGRTISTTRQPRKPLPSGGERWPLQPRKPLPPGATYKPVLVNTT